MKKEEFAECVTILPPLMSENNFPKVQNKPDYYKREITW